MKKKLENFLKEFKNFDLEKNSDKVVILVFFTTEVLKKLEATTKDLKYIYEIAGLPAPQNFGGEIGILRKRERLLKTKTGYKLSRAAKEWVLKKKAPSSILQKNGLPGSFLTFSNLHPEVKKVSKGLFDDGHYSQAILEAYKAVVNAVKDVSGVKNRDGKPLMEFVFSINNPVIKLNNLQSQSEIDEQTGMMLLFSGAALGIRNPKAHDYVVQKDPIRTLEYLNFASLLLKRLDERF